MDLLCLLAAAVLTKAGGGDRPVRNPLLNQPDISQECLSCEPNRREQWNRVQDLEPRVSDLEIQPLATQPLATQQFAPVGVLEGEVVLGISGISGHNLGHSVVLQSTVEFILNMSFTGEDRLQVGIKSGSATDAVTDELTTDELTFEGRLGFLSRTDDHRFEVSELSYEFPIGDRVNIYISTSGNDLDDFNPLLGNSSDGAISEFGTENPIYALVPDVGLQLNYDLTEALGIRLGYFSEDAGNPKSGAGLFNGNQSAFVQLGFAPSDSLLLGLTYIFTDSSSSLETGTGSRRSQINLERPVTGNSYGVSALFLPNPRLAIGGWIGFTNATVLGLGNAEVWNYALTLALPDFGKAGNLLGVVMGQEPRLTGTSGFTIDGRSRDPDTSLHVEAFYRNRLSDHISLTPGLIWITAPNHDQRNPDILVFTVRATFEF